MEWNTLTYVLITLSVILIIIIIVLCIVLCRLTRKERKSLTREVKIDMNAKHPLVSHYGKAYDDEDINPAVNMSNMNGFKSFTSHMSEKPILDTTMNSFSMKHQMNVNEFIDYPPASYHQNNTFNLSLIDNNDHHLRSLNHSMIDKNDYRNSILNRSLIDNNDYRNSILNRSLIDNNEYILNRGYLSPVTNLNQNSYLGYDMGPSLQRYSYCSTAATTESQYMPSLKTLMNYSFSEVNDARRRSQKSLQHKQSRVSSTLTTNGMVNASSVVSSRGSSVITSSIPGNNNSLGRNNLRSIPTINDGTNLHENSFQSDSSHVSYVNTNAVTQDRSIPLISLQKSPTIKNSPLDTTISNQSLLHPSQQNVDINLNNFRIGPSFSIADLENEIDQDCDVDDVDAIVDNAESILECLSHQSYSSSTNQTSSLLGNNTPLSMTANISHGLKTDYIYSSSQNPVDAVVGGMNTGIIQRNRSNSQSNTFQKTIPLELQPSLDTYLKKIPENKSTNNKSESVIDQSGYNTSYVSVKRSRSYLGSKKAERAASERSASEVQSSVIIPDDLKIDENNSNVDDGRKSQASRSYVYLKDDENDIDTDLSKVKIQKLYGPSSPSLANKNINSNYLNYKKAQMKNDNTGEETTIKSPNKSFSILNSLSIKTKGFGDSKNQASKELNKDILDNQKSPTDNVNSSFIQGSTLKSPTNFFVKSPLSPIMSADESGPVFNIAQKSMHIENPTSIRKIGNPINLGSNFDEAFQPNANAEKSIIRGVSYDEYSQSNNEKYVSRGMSYDDYNSGNLSAIGRFSRSTYNGSMDRSFTNGNSRIVRNTSQKSIATTNTSLSRSHYNPSLSLNRYSAVSHLDDDTSTVFTEGQSIVSVENIVPSVKHTHKGNSNKKKIPQLHKVEVSYSFDEIPEEIDINDEIEDVFMRPSMMRVVEVEPSPILMHEPQSTRISYISNQSSEAQNILNQDILNSFSSDVKSSKDDEEEEVVVVEEVEEEVIEKEDSKNEDEDEEKTAKNEKLESPNTLMSHVSPVSPSNEIIQEASISTADYDNRNSSSLERLLKKNKPSTNEEDSLTLNENTVPNDILKVDN